MDLLTLMGIVAVILVVTATVHLLSDAPTRRAYMELLTLVFHEFKEKHS